MVFSWSTAPGEPRLRTGLLALLLAGVLGACATIEPAATTRARFDPAPHPANSAGVYKLGAPYKLNGVWYVPAEQPNYDAVGLASWYGSAFDHRKTANGEVFDIALPSAAHATLPMPCFVVVTNLENGRTMKVRMNDRGPFHPGRIIDLSRAAAERLGFAAQGTAKVRVRYAGPASVGALQPQLTYVSNPAFEPAPPLRPMPTYQIVPPPLKHSPPTTGAARLVQAGAFSTREAAGRVAARLASVGETRIDPVRRSGAVLYRVMVVADQRRVVALGFADARAGPGM